MINNEQKIKNQKIAIIVLSILLSIVIAFFVGNVIYTTLNAKSIEISLTNYYNQNWSTCYEIEITCNENKVINVNDFTYLKENKNTCVNKIIFNDEEYVTEDSFVIYKNNVNKLKVYASSWIITQPPVEIYYKFKQIKIGETKKII